MISCFIANHCWKSWFVSLVNRFIIFFLNFVLIVLSLLAIAITFIYLFSGFGCGEIGIFLEKPKTHYLTKEFSFNNNILETLSQCSSRNGISVYQLIDNITKKEITINDEKYWIGNILMTIVDGVHSFDKIFKYYSAPNSIMTPENDDL